MRIIETKDAPVLNAFHIESGESRKENLVIME